MFILEAGMQSLSINKDSIFWKHLFLFYRFFPSELDEQCSIWHLYTFKAMYVCLCEVWWSRYAWLIKKVTGSPTAKPWEIISTFGIYYELVNNIDICSLYDENYLFQNFIAHSLWWQWDFISMLKTLALFWYKSSFSVTNPSLDPKIFARNCDIWESCKKYSTASKIIRNRMKGLNCFCKA